MCIRRWAVEELHSSAKPCMHICMRTTLDLEDTLLARARRKAAERQTTLTRVIEEALRHYLSPRRVAATSVRGRWKTVTGTGRPEVDIADRDRLYDAMERPES